MNSACYTRRTVIAAGSVLAASIGVHSTRTDAQTGVMHARGNALIRNDIAKTYKPNILELYLRVTEVSAKLQRNLDAAMKFSQWIGFSQEYLDGAAELDSLTKLVASLTPKDALPSSAAIYGELATRVSLALSSFVYSISYYSWGWPELSAPKAVNACRDAMSQFNKLVFEFEKTPLTSANRFIIPKWMHSIEFAGILSPFEQSMNDARGLMNTALATVDRRPMAKRLRELMISLEITYCSFADVVRKQGVLSKLQFKRNSALLDYAEIACIYGVCRLDPRTWLGIGLLVATAKKEYTHEFAEAIGAALKAGKR